ncbi:hypothetical protein PLICRDRAFT_90132 [Plicaturopsis crispa FD-325 SS-3]|nr:hypothetical protein PLICRDRAFT_90132 [Plicaturopsis crispa FD-325 SS-3]
MGWLRFDAPPAHRRNITTHATRTSMTAMAPSPRRWMPSPPQVKQSHRRRHDTAVRWHLTVDARDVLVVVGDCIWVTSMWMFSWTICFHQSKASHAFERTACHAYRSFRRVNLFCLRVRVLRSAARGRRPDAVSVTCKHALFFSSCVSPWPRRAYVAVPCACRGYCTGVTRPESSVPPGRLGLNDTRQ